MVNASFPFSCIVGQEDLKLALLLAAVDPTIGGVLITGERGTAKSTAARAMAALLPKTREGADAPFVELPLGATEDRLVGALNISTVLREGRTELKSGLLAQADGGVLYVDEVNLLPDHLVDLLLDTAASGSVRIERDGLSASEAARFLLVGTMNPEEGDLRPQFVDRFALSVEVRSLSSQDERMAAIRSRLTFDAAPSAARAAAQPAEERLRAQILEARARLPALPVGDAHLAAVAKLALGHQVAGIRADLAMVKAARALAAWEHAPDIRAEHIERVAALALAHRARRQPAAKRRAPPPAFASGISDTEGPSPPATERPAVPSDGPSRIQPADDAALNMPAPRPVSFLTDLVDPKQSGRRRPDGAAQRRAVGAAPFEPTGTLAIERTLITAAGRGARLTAGGVPLVASDLRQHDRSGAGRGHVLFLVDSSGSMNVQHRLDLAKEAAAGLLDSSRLGRDEVALMTFRGESADLVLPFTRQVDRIGAALVGLPAGGRTPLAAALHDAVRVLKGRDPAILVLLTDGRANVGLTDGDPWADALAACRVARGACAGALVVDCERGPILLGRARSLAEALDAECIGLAELDAAPLEVRIRRRMESL
jgi:magnesium chelatase subunit D